jgi:hypothetical protein
MRHWMESQPDIMPLQMCLFQVSTLEKQSDGKNHSQELHAMEIYIAGRFGKAISDPATWSGLFASTIPPDQRERAKQIVAKYPNPSEKEIAEAKTVVQPLVGELDHVISSREMSPLSMAAMQAGFAMVPLAFGSLFCALAFRSGLAMLIFGVVAVKRDGSRAGRLRVFWRALVTWSPYVLGFIGLTLILIGGGMFADTDSAEGFTSVMGIASGVAIGLFAALAVVSALLPERSIQDRLAGTWLVPR